jgi:hypothetical protein
MKTKFFLTILILASLFLTACPKAKDIKTAFKASASIAKYTGTAAQTVGELYTAGVIDYATKERLIAKLRVVAENGKRFHQEVEAVYQMYKNALPDKELNALDIIFNRDVIAPLVDLLTDAGLLSPNAGAQVLTALIFLKQAVLTVADLFGKLRPGQSASFKFYLEHQEFYKQNRNDFEKELITANV